MRIFLTSLACVGALASPAAAEVVQTGEGSFVVRHSLVVGAPQVDVWKQLLRPADWWSSDHTYSGDASNLWLDSQATGCFCEKLPRKDSLPEDLRPGSVEHMRVIYVEPPRALRMVGGLGPLQAEPVTAVMTFSIRSSGTRTGIAMDYVVSGLVRRKSEDMAPVIDKVLGEQMARLAGRFPPVEPVAPAPTEPTEPAAEVPPAAPVAEEVLPPADAPPVDGR